MGGDLMLVIACVAALAAVLSDMVMLGGGSSGRAFLKDPFRPLAAIGERRILIGNLLGVLALPLMILGLMPLYRLLEGVGAPQWSIAPLVLLAWSLAIGTASHASWPFMGLLIAAGDEHSTGRARQYFTAITLASGLLFTAGGIGLSVTFMLPATRLDPWWALANPLLFYLAGTLLVRWLPSPIGGYVAPAVFNLGWALFYGALLFVA